MRLNKFIASRSDLSRRSADQAISNGRVLVNGEKASNGYIVTSTDTITLDGHKLSNIGPQKLSIIFNKPTGYVCSRSGQGSNTIYDILPEEYQALNPAGRLDKYSSGLLFLTNDGDLSNQLTHPRNQKVKIYTVKLDKTLAPIHQQMISDIGIKLEDGISKLGLEKLQNGSNFRVTMREGRNRQIRRTFRSLGYEVLQLHRTNFGPYSIAGLEPGETIEVKS